jgi:hypothetical protein
VIAYEEHVSVSGVGFNIGCGKLAVRLDAIADKVGPILADIAKNVSFGIGRCNAEKVEHELFDSPLWHEVPEIGKLPEPVRCWPRAAARAGSEGRFVKSGCA